MNGRNPGNRSPGRSGVDGRESGGWRSPPAQSLSPAGRKPVRTDPCAIAAEDLVSLSNIHTLLRALNDAYAGGSRTAELVENVPVLRARCIRRARKRFPAKGNCTLPEALTMIGNIGLESELLQLLEDLTVLSSELPPTPEVPPKRGA